MTPLNALCATSCYPGRTSDPISDFPFDKLNWMWPQDFIFIKECWMES